MDQDYTQKHLLLLFCCALGRCAARSMAGCLGRVTWRGPYLYPVCTWRICCPTASCSSPSSSRPNGDSPLGKILLTLLSCGHCRDVGSSQQCDPAAVPLTQTPPADLALTDSCRVLSWFVLWLQSLNLIMETAEAVLLEGCRQRCAQLCIFQSASGPMQSFSSLRGCAPSLQYSPSSVPRAARWTWI